MSEDILKSLGQEFGEVQQVKLPSGMLVIIRDLNGEDETIISNVKLTQERKSFDAYLSNIVVAVDGVVGNPSFAQVKSWKLRDKYATLIFSRIMSIGEEVRFQYQFPKDETPLTFVENLSRYVWDYNTPFPKKGEDNYDVERIPPYDSSLSSNERELELTSGKKVRYLYANGVTESYMLDRLEEELHKHTELLARQLSFFDGKAWIRVQNFKMFSIKDTREIWNDINTNDRAYNLVTELEHPRTDEMQIIPIVGIQDFFFPEEI